MLVNILITEPIQQENFAKQKRQCIVYSLGDHVITPEGHLLNLPRFKGHLITNIPESMRLLIIRQKGINKYSNSNNSETIYDEIMSP